MGILKAIFEGTEIPVNITKVNRNITPKYTAQTKTFGNRSGAEFINTKYEQKTISIEYQVSNQTASNLAEFRRKTAGMVGKKELGRLIFSDEPNLYYEAILEGEAELSEADFASSGNITFLVPDGVAHSTVEKTFSADPNASNVLELTIENTGTESTPVDYNITNNAENGYIGIVSEHGVIELGNIKEVDGETVKMSETLLNYQNYAAYSKMTNGQGIFFDSSYGKSGTWKETTYDGKSWLDINSAGTGSGWHGAAKTITLPADTNGEVGATNFALQAKAWFRPTAMDQLGIMEYAIADTDGAHLMSVRIARYEPNRSTAYIIFCIAGKEMQRVEFDPFYSQIAVHDSGNFYMGKSGDKVIFNFGGEYPFTVPEIATKKAKTISLFVGQRDSYPLVERMRTQYMSFRKDNVDKWSDIPNRFQSGEEIYIDGKSGTVYRNGIASMDDEVVGSSYPPVPPGTTKVQVYYSDFCGTAPTVEAKIREAWL